MLLSFIPAKSEFLTNAAINEVTTSDERLEDYVILTMLTYLKIQLQTG